MIRKTCVLMFAGIVLCVAGCRKHSAQFAVSVDNATVGSGLAQYRFETREVDADSVRRYIAETDRVEIVTPEANVQRSWESAIQFCAGIQCEVVNSSITARTADSAPSGDIALRVVPSDLNKLLAHLETLGTVASRTTTRQDKTREVIDVDAEIKNLTLYRDDLRAMLSKPSATVKDLIEIQQQLADTQSHLDGIASERKVLANETEKVACQISFVVRSDVSRVGPFADIHRALREAGADFLDSTASVITTVVMVIPWLVFIALSIWLLVAIWKLAKRRRHRIPAGA